MRTLGIHTAHSSLFVGRVTILFRASIFELDNASRYTSLLMAIIDGGRWCDSDVGGGVYLFNIIFMANLKVLDPRNINAVYIITAVR